MPINWRNVIKGVCYGWFGLMAAYYVFISIPGAGWWFQELVGGNP